MAMRGRGGRTNPSRPPRLIVGRVYEQFKPMSEWRQEDDHDTLLVYLPGFQKEYIKVTTEDVNTVRVRGERLIAENRWSRFQEDFRVPENCDMRGIRARFDGGILTITMPRKSPTTNAPTTTTTAPRVAPKTEEQPFRRTKQEEALPQAKNESKEKATALESLQKPDRPPSPLKGSSSLPPQPMPPSSSKPSKQEALPKPKPESKEKATLLESENKSGRPPSPLKGSSSLPPQPIPPSSSRPLKTASEATEKNEELRFGSVPTSVPKKEKHDVVEKPNEEREIHQKSVYGKTDLYQGKGKEKSLEEEMTRVSEGRMGTSGVSHGGFLGDKVEEIKKVMARREVKEDRKLLVNVGVGVLVIVALGVHVSYAIGLISKGK